MAATESVDGQPIHLRSGGLLDRVPQVDGVIDLLSDDAVLLVFVVVGLGAGVGAVRVRGVALGPAAALFVGLAVGAVDESLSATGGLAVLRQLGLVLFTYTIGLASGPTFFAGIRRGGARAAGLTAGLIVVLAVLCERGRRRRDRLPEKRCPALRRVRWLRRRSALNQCRSAWWRKAATAQKLPGTA